jgi:hypothetical protein
MVVDRNGALILPVGDGSKFMVSSLGAKDSVCRGYQLRECLSVGSIARKRGQIIDKGEGANGINH